MTLQEIWESVFVGGGGTVGVSEEILMTVVVGWLLLESLFFSSDTRFIRAVLRIKKMD